MTRTKNPDWPHELAGALGSIAISFASYEFIFAHIVGFAENLDKATLYREVLTLPPSEKLKRFRRHISGKTDDLANFYSTVCDRFEGLLADRNRYIHAYWYRVQGKPDNFIFIDIHGMKDKLSKETHTCTVDDVLLVSDRCAMQVHNLSVLMSDGETQGFFTYYTPPDALPVTTPNPRKVAPRRRKPAQDHP